MLTLKPDECRVLGVLVEKALTTPAQYPLTLNALTTGCNQKNNRFPVVNWDDERVMDALDALRQKGLVREALLTGSRVAKFRHMAREVLSVDTTQLVIVTELLLRGPQSIGDIRQNASRMHPIESLEIAKGVLDALAQRTEGGALVKEIPPPPGTRARLYVQLLCPDLHPLGSLAGSRGSDDENGNGGGETGTSSSAGSSPGLSARVDALEAEVARLRAALSKFAGSLGEPDPLG